MANLQKGVPGSYQIISPPNLLRAKVGGGTPGFDGRTIERAETAIAKLGDDFPAQADACLAAMRDALNLGKIGDNAGAKSGIFAAAFELKSTGGMFDYPLVSDIANNLCVYLEKVGELDKKGLDIASAHYDAMRAVIANRMTGDGGAIGDRLFDSLSELTNGPKSAAAA